MRITEKVVKMEDKQKMSNIYIIIVSIKVQNSKRRLKKEKTKFDQMLQKKEKIQIFKLKFLPFDHVPVNTDLKGSIRSHLGQTK